MKDRGAGVTANRTLALLRVFFNWLIGRAVMDVSPVAGVKPPTSERSRDRILDDREIVLFWLATERTGFPFGPMFRLLLLTGQRREEVAGMKWSEIDLDAQVWTLEGSRTKNDRRHTVPLTPLAIDLLRHVPRIAGCDFVFSTNGRTHISGYGRAKSILDRHMAADGGSVPEWRLHDLRRTAASIMARLSQPVHVVEAVLNHKSGTMSGIVGIYQRYDYAEEKVRALAALSRFVLDLTGDKPAANVVPIREAAQ